MQLNLESNNAKFRNITGEDPKGMTMPNLKKACLYVSSVYLQDAIFSGSKLRDPNDHLAPFRALRARFLENGYQLSTQDVNDPADSAFVLYNDILPDDSRYKEKSYALLLESEAVLPKNFLRDRYDNLRRIFTWDERVVKECGAEKVNYALPFPKELPFFEKPRNGFCVMIASNKKSSHPFELYTDREQLARFESNKVGKWLDLFGPNWDRRSFRRGDRYLAKIPLLTKIMYSEPKTWRGVADDKDEVMSNYLFSICYENVQGIPGYVTEKIFDSFRVGTIPIYLGDPNIGKSVPETCYIDRRKFSSDMEMIAYIQGLGKREIREYRNAIYEFITGPAKDLFGLDVFCEKIVNKVIGDLDGARC